MSRFLSARYRDLTPYVPGEQPAGRQFIKLNTNESPFTVSPEALAEAWEKCRPFHLYSDPESVELRKAMGGVYGLTEREVLACNGSDEALNLAFMTFCDEQTPALFPDVTYGFYRVAADAKLRLDFPGTNHIKKLVLGGRSYHGIVSARDVPEYLSGDGALCVATKGTMMIIR